MAWHCCLVFYGAMLVAQMTWIQAMIPPGDLSTRSTLHPGSYSLSIHPTKTDNSFSAPPHLFLSGSMSDPSRPHMTHGWHGHSHDLSSMDPSFSRPHMTHGWHGHSHDLSSMDPSFSRPHMTHGWHGYSHEVSNIDPSFSRPHMTHGWHGHSHDLSSMDPSFSRPHMTHGWHGHSHDLSSMDSSFSRPHMTHGWHGHSHDLSSMDPSFSRPHMTHGWHGHSHDLSSMDPSFSRPHMTHGRHGYPHDLSSMDPSFSRPHMTHGWHGHSHDISSMDPSFSRPYMTHGWHGHSHDISSMDPSFSRPHMTHGWHGHSHDISSMDHSFSRSHMTHGWHGHSHDLSSMDPSFSRPHMTHGWHGYSHDLSSMDPSFSRPHMTHGWHGHSPDLSITGHSFSRSHMTHIETASMLSSGRPQHSTMGPMTNVYSGRTDSVTLPTTPPRQTFTYNCPASCVSCGVAKRQCMALDEYGDIRSTYTDGQAFLNDFQRFKDMGLFDIGIQIATCDGFKTFFQVFSGLSTTVTTNFLHFLNDNATVAIGQFEEFPKKFFQMLKVEFRTSVFSRLTTAEKVYLCTGLEMVDCITKNFTLDLLNCVNILMNNGGTLTTEDKKKLIDIYAYESWSDDKWNEVAQYYLDVLNSEHYYSMPIATLVDNMEYIETIVSMLNPNAKNTIKRRLKTYMLDQMPGVPSTTQDHWVELMNAFGAEPALFSEVLGVTASLSKIKMTNVSKEDQLKFLDENKDNINLATLTSTEITGLISGLTEDDMLQLDAAELEAAASAIFTQDIDEYQMRKIVEVYRMNLPDFFNPSLFNAAKMETFAPVIGYLTASEIDLIPTSLLRISGTRYGKTSRKTAKKMLEAFTGSSGSGSLSSDDIKTLGVSVFVGSLEADLISSVPAASFDAEIIAEMDKSIEELEMSGAVKDNLLQKMVEGAGITEVLKSPNLAKDVPTSLLVDQLISLSDIGGESTKFDFVVTLKQARFLMEEVNKLNVLLTYQRISNILPYACALSNEQINGIEKDGFYFDILNKLTESSCVTIDTISLLHGLFKEYLSFDSTSDADLQATTTRSTLGNMPPIFLAKLTQTELNKYGSTMCSTIVDQLALVTIDQLSKTELQEKYSFCIACLSKTTGTLTTTELSSIGNMVCGMPAADYVRLDNDALEEYVKWMQINCPMTNTERQAIVSAFVTTKSLTSSIKAYEILMVGTSIEHLPQTLTDSISVKTWLEVAGPIQDEYSERKKCIESRKQAGFSSETSSDDETALTNGEKTFYTKIAQAIQSNADAGARRRKRSSTPLTCSNIQVLGAAGVSALSTTQLGSLADGEFTNCIEILGSVTDYSNDQKTTLLDVAMRATVWGDPSTWSATNLYNAGVICQAMTETQIGTLTLDLDAVSRLGQFDGWDSLKKTAVYERWLSQQKGGDSSTITSSELRSLGHITCGATTSHIDVIPHAIYKNAADSIGELTTCEDTQLQSFATLAKAAYGSDVTTWPSSVISNIGITIGGLSTADIALLSSTQIAAINSNHIAHIPPATFAGFTVDQFTTFSTSQAFASTATQRSALSEAQLNALSASFSTSSDNAIAVTSSGMLLVVLSVAMVYQ